MPSDGVESGRVVMDDGRQPGSMVGVGVDGGAVVFGDHAGAEDGKIHEPVVFGWIGGRALHGVRMGGMSSAKRRFRIWAICRVQHLWQTVKRPAAISNLEAFR